MTAGNIIWKLGKEKFFNNQASDLLSLSIVDMLCLKASLDSCKFGLYLSVMEMKNGNCLQKSLTLITFFSDRDFGDVELNLVILTLNQRTRRVVRFPSFSFLSGSKPTHCK